MERGGDQFIPRPDRHALGGPPPWVSLPRSARQFSMADLRAAIATFGAPHRGPEVRPEHRPAAVLLALFERADETYLVFIKRPTSMSTHQGQIAFPGGTRDPDDADLAVTALREAHEELGLDPVTVQVVGELDTIATIATPFIVTPYVGLLADEPQFVPHPGEVDAVFAVPLSELFDERVYREEHWDLPADIPGLYGRPERSVFFYELPGETVWGATARILTNLLTGLAATRM